MQIPQQTLTAQLIWLLLMLVTLGLYARSAARPAVEQEESVSLAPAAELQKRSQPAMVVMRVRQIEHHTLY